MMKLLGLVGLVMMVGLSSCMSTKQAYDVEPTGFLQDYSKLRPGGDGEAILMYINPDVDWNAYKKFMIHRVVVWRHPDSDFKDVPEADLQKLAKILTTKIITAVKSEGYARVHEPGPDVMRISAAITEATQSNTVMDTLTTPIPLPSLSRLATGTHAFVGKAGIEGEITDSVTGKVLGQAVDRRAGGRTFEGSRDSWFHVEQAFEYWADRLAYRLCREKGKAYCVIAE